ncbi:hypothetical protein [Streptomyces phaeolivaceus]|uniref:hypothetical protein n=1 Tax=Streptomyces phaeolivaceus TaxID=2653200 RepID=UPI001D053795|nr:hypothetical protein [Streptomyces phaeolivaceus]
MSTGSSGERPDDQGVGEDVHRDPSGDTSEATGRRGGDTAPETTRAAQSADASAGATAADGSGPGGGTTAGGAASSADGAAGAGGGVPDSGERDDNGSVGEGSSDHGRAGSGGSGGSAHDGQAGSGGGPGGGPGGGDAAPNGGGADAGTDAGAGDGADADSPSPSPSPSPHPSPLPPPSRSGSGSEARAGADTGAGAGAEVEAGAGAEAGSEVGGSPDRRRLSTTSTTLLGLFLLADVVFVCGALVTLWPTVLATVEPGAEPTATARWAPFGLGDWSLTADTAMLLAVVVCSALGSFVHAATSFATYVGNRRLYASWLWWYLLRAGIGVALSLLVYFLLRGGLFAGSSGAGATNPYGFSGIAGLCGLFSKQATDKLREICDTLLSTTGDGDRDRRDGLAAARRGDPGAS